ncbi:MAG: hypothetical protein AAGH15_13620 [Myxococcota bacterium]
MVARRKPPGEARTVVLVGDAGKTLTRLRAPLEALGHLRMAWDPASALRLCDQIPRPLLAVVDATVVQDALGLVRDLRALGSVPVLVLIRRGNAHATVEAINAGARAVVTMPIRPAELRAALARALRGSVRPPALR